VKKDEVAVVGGFDRRIERDGVGKRGNADGQREAAVRACDDSGRDEMLAGE